MMRNAVATQRARPSWRQHLTAAVVFAVCGVTVSSLISIDRAPPLLFIDGKIAPDVAHAGDAATVIWHDEWRRRCEGLLSREIVGADGIVRAYIRHPIRIPVRLGEQTSATHFTLPADLPSGDATYRAMISFADCGFTSRYWPIEVRVPSIVVSIERR